MTRLITRRSLSLALAALPFGALAAPKDASLSAEDKALVDRAAAYLQGLTQAKSRFVQTDPMGRNAAGTVYLKRPGKARFAYDPPSGLLVVADGTFVSIHNAKLKTFERYPLGTTPLSLFLARRIKIDDGVVIARVTRFANGFSLVARDGKGAANGTLTLTFSDKPLQLLGWSVADPQGRETRVRLAELTATSALDPALFVLKDPRPPLPGRAKM